MTFEEYYLRYLDLHKEWRCRLSHFMGINFALAVAPMVAFWIYSFFAPQTLLEIILSVVAALTGAIVVAHLVGYGFAIPSHYLFAGNKPASATGSKWRAYKSDWRMWREIWAGKISIWSPPVIGDF